MISNETVNEVTQALAGIVRLPKSVIVNDTIMESSG